MTKHSFLVMSAEEVSVRIAETSHLASARRPGPVFIDATKPMRVEKMDFVWPPGTDLPGHHPTVKPNARQIHETARLIATATRPVLHVGGEATRSDASEAIVELSELGNLPTVTTLTGCGSVPDSHPNYLGTPRMHGSVPVVAVLQESDLIAVLSARFDDRVTDLTKGLAPPAKVVHIDIDPIEISKNRLVDVPIARDLEEAVDELISGLQQA